MTKTEKLDKLDGIIQGLDKSRILQAIEVLVNDDFGCDIDYKLAFGEQFGGDEVIELAKRFMKIYVLVHGFETECCKSKKETLMNELLVKKGE